MTTVRYQLSISPIRQLRAAYRATRFLVYSGSAILGALLFFGSLFYLLTVGVQSLQAPSHDWLNNTLHSSMNATQIHSYEKLITWKPGNIRPIQAKDISFRRLNGILTSACSGQALLAGIPIIGSATGFMLGAWVGYQAP